MTRFRDLPLRTKLVLVVMATSLTAVALAVAGQAVVDAVALRRQLREQLTMAARIVGSNSEAALRFGDAAAAQEALAAFRHHSSIVAAALYTADGQRLASVAEHAHHALPPQAGGAVWKPRAGVLQVTEEIRRDGELVGRVVVRAEEHELGARLRTVGLVAAGILACALALAAFLATRLQAVISEPIMALVAATRRIAEQRDYRLRVERSCRDEVGDLIDSFNGMLAEIERRDSELRSANERLEDRVWERTAELEEARQRAVEQAVILQQQAMELEEARDSALASVKAKSAFLANMSHEIRTPLHGVIGMVDLLTRTPLTDEQTECVRTIQLSAESLLAILNDILDYSRIEAGRLRIEAVPFDIARVVEEVVGMLAVPGQARGLEIQCFVDPALPAQAIGDPTRVRQILTNLVSNAIKFTAEGGVWVEATAVAEEPGSAVVRFTVTDTGVGVPESARETIFDSFTQADDSMARRFGGTGLGLSISHSLAQAMGGRLWLAQSSERGSTFVAEIPFALADAATEPAPAAPAGLRVLLVHRHALGWCAVERLLRAWGCEVREAPGPREAAAWLRTAVEPPRLVLMDLGEDEAGAAEAIRATRAACPEARIVRVGHAAQREDAAGAPDATLVRPVRREALRAALDAAPAPLRAASPAATGETPQGQPPTGEAPLRVLVVDDNAVNRKVAARMLERLSCDVATATGGAEAVGVTAHGGFDLVLMDMQMPDVDGVAATRAIRERERTTGARLTIVAMTANAMSGDREACYEAGMDGYLAKPVTMQQLEELLSRLREGGPESLREAA